MAFFKEWWKKKIQMSMISTLLVPLKVPLKLLSTYSNRLKDLENITSFEKHHRDHNIMLWMFSLKILVKSCFIYISMCVV